MKAKITATVTSMGAHQEDRDIFANLRRFMHARPSTNRCELCGKELYERHPHLLKLAERSVVCSCEECAILFSGQTAANYRRIPRDARWLADFEISDAQWDALGIPIGIAYFCTAEGRATARAFYPSPAGAMESLLSMDSWQEMAQSCAELETMQTEVEALLVNRLGRTERPGRPVRADRGGGCYIVPIDDCYHLVGLIRSKWRGFSGGDDVWQGIEDYFALLQSRAIRIAGSSAPEGGGKSAEASLEARNYAGN